MKKTALHQLHIDAGARMVSFAGYEMPVQYAGIKAEHLHTRELAGLFDVSHMVQLEVSGSSAIIELEQLLPLELASLAIGRQCYSFFPLENGGILDDLIIARIAEDRFYLVVNAARREQDIAHLRLHLKQASLQILDENSLLALQGPRAAAALTRCLPELLDVEKELSFMSCKDMAITLDGEKINLRLCRSGYTGEDGFELSLADDHAAALARKLLADSEVEWIGLGARDSLRLEAGLCLYGQDLDESTSPSEARLAWSIHKSRRSGGEKEGGFIGSQAVLAQLDNGVRRRRTGYLVDGKAPVREGAILVDADNVERAQVSSGGFSPRLARPILMAYTDATALETNEPLFALVRGRKIPVIQTAMPFVPRSK